MFFVLELYFELVRKEFTESCVYRLETNLIPNSLDALHRLYCLRQTVHESTNDFRGIKLHLLLHIPHFIRRYGAPLNWDTSSRSEEHTSELQSLMRISYAVFCLTKTTQQ